jgi:hypothetical protein
MRVGRCGGDGGYRAGGLDARRDISPGLVAGAGTGRSVPVRPSPLNGDTASDKITIGLPTELGGQRYAN